MKKLFIPIAAFFTIALSSCETEKDPTAEALKLQLTATEAQLINVSAELAKCKGVEEEADTTKQILDSTATN
jgi:hypothetical protein